MAMNNQKYAERTTELSTTPVARISLSKHKPTLALRVKWDRLPPKVGQLCTVRCIPFGMAGFRKVAWRAFRVPLDGDLSKVGMGDNKPTEYYHLEQLYHDKLVPGRPPLQADEERCYRAGGWELPFMVFCCDSRGMLPAKNETGIPDDTQFIWVPAKDVEPSADDHKQSTKRVGGCKQAEAFRERLEAMSMQPFVEDWEEDEEKDDDDNDGNSNSGGSSGGGHSAFEAQERLTGKLSVVQPFHLEATLESETTDSRVDEENEEDTLLGGSEEDPNQDSSDCGSNLEQAEEDGQREEDSQEDILRWPSFPLSPRPARRADDVSQIDDDKSGQSSTLSSTENPITTPEETNTLHQAHDRRSCRRRNCAHLSEGPLAFYDVFLTRDEDSEVESRCSEDSSSSSSFSEMESDDDDSNEGESGGSKRSRMCGHMLAPLQRRRYGNVNNDVEDESEESDESYVDHKSDESDDDDDDEDDMGDVYDDAGAGAAASDSEYYPDSDDDADSAEDWI